MAAPDRLVLSDVLRDRAHSDPDQLAFAHREDQLTFADLAERATARAAGLQRRGVGPGDRVAVAMSTGLPFAETFWALQLIGAVPCAFNPFVPAETLTRRIERVRPRLVVTDELAGDLRSGGAALREPEITSDDLAFLQLTSGTSGAARASMILHRNVLAYLRPSGGGGQLVPGDVFVCWAPPWHDLGLVRFVIGPVFYGISCHIVTPAVKTIPEWLETVSRVRGTVLAAPDFAYRLAVRMVDASTLDLSSLRFATSGGEPVRWSSIEDFETKFDVPGVVMPAYGLGEATLGVTTHVPGDEIVVDERGNVSCGTSRYGLELRAGRSLDSPEEILVRGDSVFAGYFDSPDDTSRTLQDGWLHTGDSGYFDAQGRLFVLGRRTGMIKRAGSVIAPRELEEAAHRAAGVRIAAATSFPAAGRDGDIIVVAVEADVSAERSADQIASDVSQEILAALGFAPSRVSVVPRRSIPRTENGKLRHDQLRAMLGEAPG